MKTNVPSIASSAMLVELSASVWTGRKLDRKTTDEVVRGKNARSKNAASVTKHLFADVESLANIQKLAGAIRVEHYYRTLPWSDAGMRLLTTAAFLDYKEAMNKNEQMFNDAVHEFLLGYDTLIAGMAMQLGDLFDASEYPMKEEIADKFGFRLSFAPVPDAGDWRVDVGNEALSSLQQQYTSAYEERLDGAMRDVWGRLHETLEHMAERLGHGKEGKANVFRDSMLENALDLCRILPSLNVTGDNKLEYARQMLEQALTGIDCGALRDSDAARAETKAKVQEIMDKFTW